ncbi:MAG: T9SS type A sorting domain-containing protein, partial [Muribaculaceae bacterium]|nr:T9SS type A sorting domain-containing protein [Muribaculaceae bacterium]
TTTLSADSLTSGIYIVKAVTSAGTATAKIILN